MNDSAGHWSCLEVFQLIGFLVEKADSFKGKHLARIYGLNKNVFCALPRLFPLFSRLSGSHQAGGTEVSSSPLPLLDLQWLLASLAASDHICPSSHIS